MGALIVGLTLSVGLVAAAISLGGPGEERRRGPAADPGLDLEGRTWYRQKVLFYTTSAEDPARGCILRFRDTEWIADDWSGEVDTEKLPRIDGRGIVNAECIEGPQGYVPLGDGNFAAGEHPFAAAMDGLPTDPTNLAEALIQSSAPGGSSPVPAVTPGPGQSPETGGWVRVLEDSLFKAPPDLQPGFYWFGRQIPGMEADDSAHDPAGRRAVSLHIVTESADRTWYFDPRSFQVLAYVVVGSDEGAFHEMHVVVEEAIVDESGDSPRANDLLVPSAAGDSEVGGVTYPLG
jgi:hypothetical protein